jgi:GNAT superfamily N-acetyltransferase
MKTLEAQLLEDFGAVDRGLARRGLLAERGISAVFDGPGDHSLTIEYDPTALTGELSEILCRHGLCSEVVAPPADVKDRERWLEKLLDGRHVLIRPIRPNDVAGNARFVEQLSPASKHFLFLGGIGQLDDTALRHLCDPDYAHDMAYIAIGLDPKTGELKEQVAVCRYTGADPVKGAEISVAVADAWQHQGLGTLLLRHLIDYARSHRVPRLYSIEARNNTRMRDLARNAGFTERPDPDDNSQVMYSLDLRGSPSRPW